MNHPSNNTPLIKANLALRFLLELAAAAAYPLSFAVGMDSGWKWALAAVSAIGFWVLWGVFATPGDPSRSGKTVIVTPGPVRLALELALFIGAAATLIFADLAVFGIALAVVTGVHYRLWPDRIRWLLGR